MNFKKEISPMKLVLNAIQIACDAMGQLDGNVQLALLGSI